MIRSSVRWMSSWCCALAAPRPPWLVACQSEACRQPAATPATLECMTLPALLSPACMAERRVRMRTFTQLQLDQSSSRYVTSGRVHQRTYPPPRVCECEEPFVANIKHRSSIRSSKRPFLGWSCHIFILFFCHRQRQRAARLKPAASLILTHRDLPCLVYALLTSRRGGHGAARAAARVGHGTPREGSLALLLAAPGVRGGGGAWGRGRSGARVRDERGGSGV